MTKSPYLERLREQVRAEGRDEGRDEGKVLGQVEQLQETLLVMGRTLFKKAASRAQKTQLTAMNDVEHLKRLRDRLLDAASWDDLLATP